MTRSLSRLFNIRADEWSRFLIIYLMYFVALTGINWAEPVVEAAFWRQVGVEFLPLAIAGNALCSIIAIIVYTAFADRVANDKLLIAILAISGVGITIGLAFLGVGWVTVTYPLLYLILNVPLLDIFNVHWPTYVNGFYDTRAAKRIIPVLGSGARIAGIVAGLTLPLLNHFLSPGGIIFVWLGALVAMALFAWFMPRILGDRRPAVGDQQTRFDLQHSIDNAREGYRYVSRSSFLRWLALATLVVMVLLAFINYQTGKILLDELKTADELETVARISNFIGLLNGLSNLIALPFQLFLLSRIIGRMGLGNAGLVYPISTLVTCGGLIFARRFPIPAAILGHLNRTTFYTVLRSPVDSLFYNAVPLRVKGRARAFIGGLIVPIGSMAGGLLLLLLQYAGEFFVWFVPTLIGVLAVGYLISAWVIRRKYAQALIAMLEQEDFSFLLSQEASTLTVTDSATLNWLREKLEQPDATPEFTIFMAQLISQVGGKEAGPILGQAARTAADARIRSATLDVLAAADLRGSEVRQIYTDFLADPDGRVRQSAIAGLERLAGPADKQFLSRMLEMVQDPDIDVRVQVLLALVRSGEFHQLLPAVQVLDQLLADEDPNCRARGVRVLGRIGDERAIRRLVEYLSDPADAVRLEAAMAAETLSQDAIPRLKAADSPVAAQVVETMIGLLQDPIERARQAALITLGRVGTRESHRSLVSALSDPSPQIRATAVEALAQVGKSAIPIVHPQLDSPNPQLRKMAAVVLSRVNPREFGGLIVGSSITGNLLAMYRNHGLAEALVPCSGYPAIAILQSALREQNHQLLDEIFYLLTAIHAPSAVKVITESLHSEDPRIRANAVEALESLTTPQIAQLVAPLFEPETSPAQLFSLSEDVWDMEQPDTATAVRQLVTHPSDPWLRTIATYALGEIGATLLPSPGPSSPRAEQRTVMFSVSDLLDGLTEDLEDTRRGDEQEERQARPARRAPPADLFGALLDTPEDVPAQPEEGEAEGPVLSEAEGAEIIEQVPAATQLPFTQLDVQTMLGVSLADPVDEVRFAARAAKRIMTDRRVVGVTKEEETLLSTIEKIIFLKEVAFFHGMTIDQLRALASVCEEEFFEEGTQIFNEGDPGGTLYVVVSGRVGIEREGQRKGSFARLATIEPHSYFGEMSLFDNRPHSAAAIAAQDTLALRLRREPLLVLVRQHPDLSLELINVLSQRLREANNRIAQLARTRPRELQRLYDGFD